MRFLKNFLLLILLTAAGNSLAASAIKNNPYDGSQTLTGYVPKGIASSTFQRHAKASEVFPMRVIMPLKPGLPALIDQLYNPKSKIYRQFLTPQQIAAQFGTSTIDSDRVKNFLVSRGFTILSQSNDRTVFRVLAPVASIKNAFNVGIDYYKKTDGTTFRAPDGDPKLPVDVAGKIIGLLGLDDLRKFQSQAHKSPLRKTKQAAIPQTGTAQGGGELGPADIAKAYNLNAIQMPANAPGQTVALFEEEGYDPTDIVTFLKYFNLPTNNIDNPCAYTSSTPDVPVDFNSPPNSSCASNVLQNILIDGYNGGIGITNNEDEAPADIEMLYEINPNIGKILIYESDSTDWSWEDNWQQIQTDNAAKIISTSWVSIEPYSNVASSDNAVFQEMAAQGQSVFVASGDCGAYGTYSFRTPCGNQTLLAVNEPAAQPYATAVGISVLSVNADGTYNNESASKLSGGGSSVLQSIPSYQQGMISAASLGSTTMRNVPDLAFNADSNTPIAVFTNGTWGGAWGSSLSAPIWAAFVSLINQGRAAVNQPELGFVNPLLYQIAQSSNYANDFHDITTGFNNYGVVVNGTPSPYYPAVTGYDDATGLGSFNGANLYNDLVPPSAPTGLNAIPSNAQITLSWNAPIGANSYNVLRATGATSATGTYTTIATALTKTSYTDTSVTNGTTYYYEVVASNFGGQGPASTPISTIPVAPSLTITVSAGTGGNISPSPKVSVGYGASQVFTVAADTGFVINQIMVDNKPVTISGGHADRPTNPTLHRIVKHAALPTVETFTLNNINANHTVFVSFNPVVTANASTGGSITPQGAVSVPIGSTKIFKVTPAQNHTIKQVLVNGSPVKLSPQNTCTLSNITLPQTITATFN